MGHGRNLDTDIRWIFAHGCHKPFLFLPGLDMTGRSHWMGGESSNLKIAMKRVGSEWG